MYLKSNNTRPENTWIKKKKKNQYHKNSLRHKGGSENHRKESESFDWI